MNTAEKMRAITIASDGPAQRAMEKEKRISEQYAEIITEIHKRAKQGYFEAYWGYTLDPKVKDILKADGFEITCDPDNFMFEATISWEDKKND